MSDPYIGEIKVISFNFPPKGWAFCNGQIMSIQQNQALFSILGVTYGGNGQTTFALPNFQGRMPIHQGNGYTTGQQGGEASHTLSVQEMPAHVHIAQGASTANQGSPVNNLWAPADGANEFNDVPDSTMGSNAIGSAGGSQPHPNEAPYLVLNFVIALTGVYPSRD